MARKTRCTDPRQAELERIAAEHLDLETLQTRNSGDADFHEHAVWCIEAALEAAYEAGRTASNEGR